MCFLILHVWQTFPLEYSQVHDIQFEGLNTVRYSMVVHCTWYSLLNKEVPCIRTSKQESLHEGVQKAAGFKFGHFWDFLPFVKESDGPWFELLSFAEGDLSS